MSGRVCVVGSLNTDLVLSVERIARPGETVLADDSAEGAGGKGANQAIAAARAGGRVSMIGCVGTDPAGERLKSALASAGVEVAGVGVAAVATGLAVVLVGNDGENAITVVPGANVRLTSPAVVVGLTDLSDGDVVVAQGEVAWSAVATAAELARKAGARLVLNLAPYSVVPDGLIDLVDVLVVNEHEAGLLASWAGVAPTAADLAIGLGRSVVVTQGASGCVVAESDGQIHTLAGLSAGEVVDTTGAGDAFVGAMVAGLAEGFSLPAAARWGTAAGAIAVTAGGAQGAPASRAQIVSLVG